MDSVELEALLQQAEQLSASISGGVEDFPRLEKNINQILANSAQLWNKTTSNVGDSNSAAAKASLLLGSKGLDLPSMQNELKKLEDESAAGGVIEYVQQSAEEQDLESVLKKEREKIIVGLIDETSRRVLEESQRRHWDSMLRQWQSHKQHILTNLLASQDMMMDLTSCEQTSVTDRDEQQCSLNMSSCHFSSQHNLSVVEMHYAKQVDTLNAQQLQQQASFSDATLMFKEVGRLSGDALTEDLWHLVSTHLSPTNSAAVTSFDNDDVYLAPSDSAVECRLGVAAQSRLVKRSLGYLQHRFKMHVQSLIFDNLKEHSIGGCPSVMSMVRAYVSSVLSKEWRRERGAVGACDFEDGLVDGHPVWALIYLCLRIGDAHSALQVVQKAPQTLGGDFYSVMNEYVQRGASGLSQTTTAQLGVEYRRRSVNRCGDVYKRLVYCVLAKCDVMENHAQVCDKIEDYLWLKLSQVKTDSTTASPDSAKSAKSSTLNDFMSLEGLQNLLVDDYGEKHFQASSQPFIYFQVLWLTGLFEDAIEFLSRKPSLRCHAVHVAIALRHSRLLMEPPVHSDNTQLLTVHRVEAAGGGGAGIKVKQLNFTRLVTSYVKRFEKTNSQQALNYYFLLRRYNSCYDDHNVGASAVESMLGTPDRDTSGGTQTSTPCDMFVTSIAELVMATGDYQPILGRRDSKDYRHPGLLDRLHPADAPVVIAKIASIVEKRGLSEQAVCLYDLAGKKQQVLVLLNRMLAPLASGKCMPGDSRDRVVSLALEIAERYQKKGVVGMQSALKTFYYLLDLVTLFDLFHSNSHDACIEVAEKLNIIPPSDMSDGPVQGCLAMLDENSMIDHVEKFINSFKGFSDEVKQNYPQVLLCCMKVFYARYSQISSTNWTSMTSSRSLTSDSSVQREKQELRMKARLLTTLIGRLPYRHPEEVSSQMAHMELKMA